MKKGYTYVLVVFFYTTFFSVFAQGRTDSLEHHLENVSINPDNILTFLQLVESTGASDTAKQAYYIALVDEFSIQSGTDSISAFCYYRLGNYFYRQNKFSKAILYFNQANSIYVELKRPAQTGEILGKIGRIYYGRGDYVKALEIYFKALKVYEDAQLTNKDLGWLLRYIGSVFKRQGNNEIALDYYNQALVVFQKKNHLDGIASCYNNLGIVYGAIGEKTKELAHYQKALIISKAQKKSSRVPVILSNIGQKLQEKGDYEGALASFNEAYLLYEEEGRFSFMASNKAAIGSVYLAQKQYKKAIQQLIAAEELAFQTDKKRAIRLEMIYSNLSWTYDSIGDAKKALKYYKRYELIKDSLAGNEVVVKTAELNAAFEAAKVKQAWSHLALEKQVVDQNLAILKQKERIISFRILLIVGVSTIIIGVLILLFIRRNKTQKRITEINQLKQEVAKIERTQLEEKLILKNRDITSFALDITRKHEFTEELLTRLSILKIDSPSEIEQGLKGLVQFVRGQVDIDKNYNFLYENVELVNSEFFNKLLQAYPALTKNERMLCGLIRINLSNKEIFVIRNVTPKAIKMGKYRLKKSLNLLPEDSLNAFIQQF